MSKISTKNLHLLPKPSELRHICKSISVLEAIICQDWEDRYYSYQKDWAENQEVFEMRNGEGDQMLVLFTEKGICMNGFAHECSQEAPIGMFKGLPEMFNEFIFGEPNASIGTTFCIWQTFNNENWQIGEIIFSDDNYKDGSQDLLSVLDGNPLSYQKWAEAYYEIDLNLESVKDIYSGIELTKDLIKALNPELEDFEKLKSDLVEIGYEIT